MHSRVHEDKADLESGESEGLLCIARRILNNESQTNPVEQFTTKLDLSGVILDIDLSGISPRYIQFLSKVRKFNYI